VCLCQALVASATQRLDLLRRCRKLRGILHIRSCQPAQDRTAAYELPLPVRGRLLGYPCVINPTLIDQSSQPLKVGVTAL
jgi:hypothetical protein